VVTDEELIEQLSFPVYRRVSTMIFVPAQSHSVSSIEMVAIDPRELKAAQDRDRATDHGAEAKTSQKGKTARLAKCRSLEPHAYD
jgi:hypothetical protein